MTQLEEALLECAAFLDSCDMSYMLRRAGEGERI